MKCDFSLDHYKEILDVALEQGYSFCSFFEKPEGKIIYLRHDIDFALDRAFNLAEIEREKGIKATYFIQLDSPFYDPFEEEAVLRISSLGHDVGLHYTKGDIEEQIKSLKVGRLFSFHRPSQELLGKKIQGFISAYEPYFFNQVKYISDSRMIWRDGCACQNIGRHEKLHILTHAVSWQQEGFNNSTDLFNDYLRRYPKERHEELKDYLRKNVQTYES